MAGLKPREGLLLHVPLVDGLDARYAGGDAAGRLVTPETPPDFVTAAGRPGARFSRGTCVEYAVAGNFCRDAGTVALWFQPDWAAQAAAADGLGRILWDLRLSYGSIVADDPSQRWALVYPNPGGKGSGQRPDATFGCWRFCVATNRNQYVIGTRRRRPDRRTRQAVFGTQQRFVAGQWLHLAVTWTATTGSIWVDGALDVRSPLPEGLPDQPLPASMQLGAQPSWINAGADGLLADFRVYDGALTEAAIKQLAAPGEAG